jgi:ribosomal protein S6E (S10)
VEGALVGDGRTDAEGQFASKQRPREIIVQAPGHVASAHRVDGDYVEIRLSALAVTGTVVGPDGRGVPNVTVTLDTQVGDSLWNTQTRTDDRGAFRFRGASKDRDLAAAMPATNYYQLGVRTTQGRDLVGGPRYVWGPQEGIVLVLAGPEEMERRLVRGTIVDEDGNPIDEAVLYRPVATDQDMNPGENWAAQRAGKPGSFVCERLEPRGEMKLVFNARGYLNSEPVTVVFDGKTAIEPIVVRLPRGTEVEVCVMEEDGTPVPGAWVFGYAKNSVQGQTDADGRCVLAGLPPGRNRITVSHRYLADANEAYVEAASGARQRVEIRGKAAGAVIVRAEPVARAKTSLLLRLLDAQGTVVSEERIDKARLESMALTFPGARFQQTLAVKQPGRYRVHFEVDGVALPEVEVQARLRETVEVDLKPAR